MLFYGTETTGGRLPLSRHSPSLRAQSRGCGEVPLPGGSRGWAGEHVGHCAAAVCPVSMMVMMVVEVVVATLARGRDGRCDA